METIQKEGGKRMNVPAYEQETTISFCRAEQTAKIWTSDTTVMTKLDKLVEKDPKNWTCRLQKDREGDVIAKEYIVQNKKLVSFRAERIMTEAQLEVIAKMQRAKFGQ
jgi:hypothetical protein